MAKLLNLDELAREERVLKLGGKEYLMKETTVGDFIEMARDSEQLKEDMTFAEQLELMVKMINRSFPTCPPEVLRNLNMAQLNAILEFARDPDPAGEKQEGGAEKK